MMRLKNGLAVFTAGILEFKERIAELSAAITDEAGLTQKEAQFRQFRKECAAYILEQTSDDIGKELAQLMNEEDTYQVPGAKPLPQRIQLFQNRVRNMPRTFDYLLNIIELSDPLRSGHSFKEERSEWTVNQKQNFLLYKLYSLRKTDRHWDTGLIFDFNEIELDGPSEGLELTMAIKKMGLVEAIGTRGGASAKITTAGKSYVEQHLLKPEEGPRAPSEDILDIFVSHSSQDEQAARLLVDLVKTAFNLPSKRIRCTSLDGYNLPAGSSVDEQLKKEVYGCKVLIGLISEQSVRSAYVLFELGARWGASRPMIPLLIGRSALLEGPLKGIHAISAFSQEQLYQLIEQLKVLLDLEPELPPVYQDKIHVLARYAAQN